MMLKAAHICTVKPLDTDTKGTELSVCFSPYMYYTGLNSFFFTRPYDLGYL